MIYKKLSKGLSQQTTQQETNNPIKMGKILKQLTKEDAQIAKEPMKRRSMSLAMREKQTKTVLADMSHYVFNTISAMKEIDYPRHW